MPIRAIPIRSTRGIRPINASSTTRVVTAALRTLAATPPPAGTNIVLVTHKPNIVDAFGKDWFDVREGEASIFRPDGKGGFTAVARVQVAEWARLAQAAP
jgi:hypothetical protein